MFKHVMPLWAFLKTTDFCYYRNNKNEQQGVEQPGFNRAIVFYDHDCLLCRQEMLRLKSLDHMDRLFLLNINSPMFNAQDWGVSHNEVAQALYVLTAEKIWLVGMPAIRYVYAQVGLGWLMAPSGWPVISWFADHAYRFIAPNRQVLSRWTGLEKFQSECTENVCAVKRYNDRA